MTDREKLVELLDIIIQPGQKTLGEIADHLIANGVTVREPQMPKWISVEDRMADEEKIALVFGRGEVSKGTLIEYLPRVHVAFTRNGEWILYDSGELVHATHWMPLPESPEEEEK
jgi:hypothetical protein